MTLVDGNDVQVASPRRWRDRFAGSYGALAMALALCATTGALAWLAFRGTVETSRSARLLLERRGAEQLALLAAGLSQDMKGAQATVLVPVTHRELVLEPPYGLAELFARGFARFPYPESFFAWKESGHSDGLAYFFNRAERRPAWYASEGMAADPYPVQVLRDPPAMRELVAEAGSRATGGRPFAVFEKELAGTPYQVVVHLLYHGESGNRLFGLVGFTVNLRWVGEVYFEELTRQLANIGGQPDEISLAIVDDRGAVVTTSRPAAGDTWSKERRFPLVFADRALLQTLPRDERLVRYWTARTSPARGKLVPGAVRSGTAFVFISVAAVAAVVGLFATVRAVRVAARLAAMKSDFVSSVTHELKTPLSSIRLIADTLASGRYSSPETIRDYARLLSNETKGLTQLLDNLLAYARLSDVESAYSFETLHVGELVDDALERFRGLLEEQQFTVEVEVPPDLRQVHADRSALLQVLENLVDNTIKYARADGARVLRIRAAAQEHRVVISVADSGIGIHDDDIARVCDKFFRGRGAKSGGSGLGLAIVRQIVEGHQGRLVINSQVGVGTRVDVVLPAEVT